MRTIGFSVDAGSILQEAIAHWSAGEQDSVGMVMGLHTIRQGLAAVARRAIEINDAPLLEILQRLGAVKASP